MPPDLTDISDSAAASGSEGNVRGSGSIPDTDSLLRAAQAAGGFGLFRWTPVRDRFFLDAQSLRLLGRVVDAGALCYRDFVNLLHEEERQRVQAAFLRALESADGAPIDVECRIVRGDDRQERWLTIAARVTAGEDGTRELGGMMTDITARKTSERALGANEERYRLLVHATASIVWRTDRHGAFIDPQTSWEAYTGQGFEAHRGWGWLEAVHEEDRASIAAGWLDALNERTHYRTQGRLWHAASGAYRRFESQAMPVFRPDGEVREWIGTIRDVEDQRRTEYDLKRTEQSLALALEAAELGAWDIDMRTGMGLWSDALFRMLGIEPTPTHIVPRELWDRAVYPDDAPMVRDAARRAAQDGSLFRPTHRILRADTGEVKWVQPAGRLLLDERGEPVRFIGVLADITERKRAEDHMRMLLDELNHRVKNSLATIQSIARQTLREGMDVGEARARLDARLMNLAQAHALLTRQGGGTADLREVAQLALAPFATGESGSDRILLEGPAVSLPPKAALSLNMAFHELATNAAKYGALSPAGGRVEVLWTVQKETLAIDWKESGGPPVSLPALPGFGMRLLERGLARDLAGSVALRFEPGGLACRITLPLQNASK
jgi:PAS domain S-box-containing protein